MRVRKPNFQTKNYSVVLILRYVAMVKNIKIVVEDNKKI